MMIVTGGAGFIGSNLVKGLNAEGINDILVVDDLTDGRKYKNLMGASFSDYQDSQDFLNYITANKTFARTIEAVFHQGACSTTTEWNGRYMMHNNYDYSKHLLRYCTMNCIPFIYASSAAVYGAGNVFQESSMNEAPLNIYGYSKYLFDQYVLRQSINIHSTVVGLRYFNVYGPREQHKGTMSSVAFHFMNQLHNTGTVKLFEGSDGYADGEQRRDFIHVDDIVRVNLWFMDKLGPRGIYNVGTGISRSFNDVAKTLIACHGSGTIEYIPFPEKLKSAYQSFTEADITRLREAEYPYAFTTLEEGLAQYYTWMQKNHFSEKQSAELVI